VNHHSFRMFFFLGTLICLVALPGILAVRPGILAARAAVPSKHTGRSFQPTGHMVAVPQRVNTASLPQSKLTSYSSGIEQLASAPIKRAQVASPSNVVNVPAPTNVDPTAKRGLATPNQPKPDASGGGGIDNYLETVEGGVGIYDRSGNSLKESNYQTWFNLPKQNFVNPVSLWDDTGDRFIFSILAQGTPKILISVAQQADATGSYCNYTFTGLPNHDFDKLGVDSDGIYVSANILNLNTGQVVSNELFSANRAAMESCQSITYTTWTALTNPDGTIAQAITPARQDNSTPGFEYLVNSIPDGACDLTLWTLTSSGNLSNISVATQCYSPPPPAKQKGTSIHIGTGDCSITQASLVNGLLTLDTTGSYDWGDGNGPVGIVEWFVLNPSTASVANQGSFGTKGYWLLYPSAITTANGNMLFVYNASGKSIYPSVWYVDQTFTDTTALANGVNYYSYGGQYVSSWGAYQSAWPDTSSVNSNAVWITGEFARAQSKWGTKFDVITPL
jgi:hypothetical protein